MTTHSVFSSQAYWDARYRAGGTSGAGSAGALARYKADTVNLFLAANAVASVIDIGCGDASLLALLTPPDNYTGVDVSPTVLARCAALHPNSRFVPPEDLRHRPAAELTMALDVLYHLIEDAVFEQTIQLLFGHATRFVLIYSSDIDASWPAAHVRHRRFTDHVAATQPAWRLLAHLPNPRPYEPARPDQTSFADFFIFGKPGAGCVVPIAST